MKLWQVALVAATFGGFRASAQTAPVYENRGVVNNPQIDATVVLNRGTMNIDTVSLPRSMYFPPSPQPFDTQGTLYFTNFVGGIITGSGGMRFDYIDSVGVHRPSANWVNGGSISFDSGGGGGGGFGFGSLVGTDWLIVNATNIQNRGGLTVDPNGIIKLQGQNVNIGRAGMRAGYDPSLPAADGFSGGVFYSNARGINDNYGGAGQNNTLDPGAGGGVPLRYLTGRNPISGPHQALINPFRTNVYNIPSLETISTIYALTNTLSPTNWVIQAVYFSTNTTDPALKVAVRFGAEPFDASVPGAKTPIIQFAYEDVDTITADSYTNFVYVIDNLGSMTNSVLQTNITTSGTGFELQKPSNFTVTRRTPPEWDAGVSSNYFYKADLIYNANYGSDTVTNWYSAYSFSVADSVPRSQSPVNFSIGLPTGPQAYIPAFDHPTNMPGRVEIEANRLDMTLARFRTDGLLSIKATNLVGAPPYKLDATTINMAVGLEQGSLNVSNIIQPFVRRFNGTINLYSAIWTNTTFTTADDPANPGTLITNTIEIRFHALIVDKFFNTKVDVDTYNFSAKAPSVVMYDRAAIRETLVIDTPYLDNRGQLLGQTNQISADNFPSLVNLTNRGVISSQFGVAIGDSSRPFSYLENTTNGSITGAVIQLTGSDAWGVSGSDITSLAGLAGLLATPTNDIARYVASRLDPTTAAELAAWKSSGIVTETFPANLAKDLSAVINGASIWDAARFQGVTLGATTQALLASAPSGAALAQLNRLLLGDAFPTAISSGSGARIINSGTIRASVGDVLLSAVKTRLDGGRTIAAGNLAFVGKELELANKTVLQAGYEQRSSVTGNTNYFNGQLQVQVTDRLADGGPTSSNSITVYDGFHLYVKPSVGDLLGTTITSKVARFSEAIHSWAGEDRGATAAGYSNNAALGQLVLDGRQYSLFTFRSPTGAPAALYVDHLVLANNATNLDLAFDVAPDFTIYFADANLPAQQLNGALGGRFVWVTNYAGAYSSVPVTLASGQVVRVNRALLASDVEDSDGDGIPNAQDSAPFEAAALRINVRLLSAQTRTAEISWSGTPGRSYQVEYTGGLSAGAWQPLATVQNAADATGPVAVVDSPADEEPRFYRVVEVR